MNAQVVVWNSDARYRPELEVDIELLCAPDEIPGEHYAAQRAELEVEIIMPFDEDAWFLDDDDIVPLS